MGKWLTLEADDGSLICAAKYQRVGAQVKAHYRRGRTVQVGELTIRRPLFLEMALGGLVRGAPGPVVGVIGAQLFWRCCFLTGASSRSALFGRTLTPRSP